ncbi:uncharacterized protein LOC116805759 isoform X2 [Drosophila grimshawi]|uniref:uncharacterized protein LOC116805759 isoform X2 n=1 Tax=Drosophila grimshawi TaxID=7222 RepID=UPI000C86E766|nr:uncharacterized protein LOC116805759 isoform X2 [Drosophila grimshawi]
MIYSNSKHFILSCEQFMMSRDSFKRQLKSNNGNVGLWQSNARNCMLLSFCSEHRQNQAEIKILNLLKHNAKSASNIHTDRFCPKDAQIIFGNCDCEKLFCKHGSCRSHWDNSRIQWLWKLEHQPWEQPSRRSRSSAPPAIELNRATKVRQNARNGCWSWLLRSCGCASDTESLDVPFTQRSIRV